MSPLAKFFAAIIRTLAGRLETETIRRPWAASQAKPLQFMPPTLPGIASIPASLGGENMLCPDIAAMVSAQNLRSASEMAKTASGPWDCGTSGGVAVG